MVVRGRSGGTFRQPDERGYNRPAERRFVDRRFVRAVDKEVSFETK